MFRAKNKKGQEVALDDISIIKSVTNRFGLASLTERDRAAQDISGVLTLSKPREDFPKVIPRRFKQRPTSGQFS